MAGEVRQPIDVAALSRYIDANVPEIKTPIDVKQVCAFPFPMDHHGFLVCNV